MKGVQIQKGANICRQTSVTTYLVETSGPD